MNKLSLLFAENLLCYSLVKIHSMQNKKTVSNDQELIQSHPKFHQEIKVEIKSVGLRSRRTYLCHFVSLSKALYSPKVLVIPRKLWFHPDMTEQLLIGMLSLKKKPITNKQRGHEYDISKEQLFKATIK